jgi:hypothetical protein
MPVDNILGYSMGGSGMCWLGFLYGILTMGLIVGIGWFLEWLDQPRWKQPLLDDDEPLLGELDLRRIAKEYAGHKDIDLMIQEIRRCWQG